MHRNRIDYTLSEYQDKLRNSYERLGLVLQSKKDNHFCIIHPIPATPWLPEGRKKYYTKIRRRAKYLKAGKKYTFATLTYSTRFYSPESAAKNCKKHFNLFLKRLQYYQNRKKLEYFYVIELTDNFMVHFHVIFDQYIPWKKIRNSWWKVTGNTATNIKSLAPKRAFAYATKYLTDSRKMGQAKFSFLFKNIDRLYTFSRGFLGAVEILEKAWQYCFLLFHPDGIEEAEDLDDDAIFPLAAWPELSGYKLINPHPDYVFLPDDFSGPEEPENPEMQLYISAFCSQI